MEDLFKKDLNYLKDENTVGWQADIDRFNK